MESFQYKILIAIPNENWEIILKFDSGEYRKFSASTARKDFGYLFLASPPKFKAFSFCEDRITWDEGGEVQAHYLYDNSIPVTIEDLSFQSLRISYKNQAPTEKHSEHHVYGVSIRPFHTSKPFSLGESIGGGIGDIGGSHNYSLSELLALDNWKWYFEMSGCAWAVEVIEKSQPLSALLNELVETTKHTNGMPNKLLKRTKNSWFLLLRRLF